MSLRPIIWISGALNLALVAALFLVPWPAPPPSASPPASPAAVPPAAAPAPEIPPAPADPAAPAEGFHWSRIASDDLKAYRDSLLAIGCPRPTVRDIIMGEINERFVHQRRALMASLQNRYWEFLSRGEAAMRTNWARPMEVLSAERGELIRDVLGQGFAPPAAELAEGRGDAEERFAWLPEEKRNRLLALETKLNEQLDELGRSLPEGAQAGERPPPEISARMEALQQEFDNARKALLTPEELEQIRLLGSKESLWAAGLSGFEPTEDEWRQVTKLRAGHEEAMSKLSDPDLSDEARRERTETLQAELARGIKDALGDRYARFEMAQNEDFQTVQKITQRYGLADSVAAEAYELQQAAVAEAEKLRDDPGLSNEERQAALTALQREAGRALAKTLGEQPLATYQEYGGDWLKQLNRSGDE